MKDHIYYLPVIYSNLFLVILILLLWFSFYMAGIWSPHSSLLLIPFLVVLIREMWVNGNEKLAVDLSLFHSDSDSEASTEATPHVPSDDGELLKFHYYILGILNSNGYPDITVRTADGIALFSNQGRRMVEVRQDESVFYFKLYLDPRHAMEFHARSVEDFQVFQKIFFQILKIESV